MGPVPLPVARLMSHQRSAVLGLATLWCGAVTRARGRSHPSLGSRRTGDVQRRCRPRVGRARGGPPRWRRAPQADFTIPPGAAAGVYAKSFPGPTGRRARRLVRVGVKAQGTRAASTDRGGHRDQGRGGRPENPPADSSPNGLRSRRRSTGRRSGRSGKSSSR